MFGHIIAGLFLGLVLGGWFAVGKYEKGYMDALRDAYLEKPHD